MNAQPETAISAGLSWEIARLSDKKAASCAIFSKKERKAFDEVLRVSHLSDKASVYIFDPKTTGVMGGGISFDFAQHDAEGLEKADMALLCSCLEYVEDPAAFVAGLAKITDKSVVLSYPGKEFYPDDEARQELGWKNHFTKDDIIGLFTYRDLIVSYFEVNHKLKRLIFQFKTGRQNTVQDNFLCCGCSACVYRCPTDAIYEKEDEHGVFRAFVDYDKCTTCGKCSRACPVITYRPPKKNTLTPKCYAFENDVSISMSSTTTGGFQVLARHFISIGGKVAGASWVKDEYGNYTRVKHVLAQSEDELTRIYRSKYVQSEIGDTFKKIKEDLDKGGKVLFSGVPCQVAGLYNAIGRGYENLYTAEILCHSTPSQKYFRKYLDEQYGPGNVKEFDFRAKRSDANLGNHIRVILSSGNEIFMPRSQDIYSRLFGQGIIMNEYCENCRFTGYPRQADITLGDFWGIQRYDPEFLGGRTEFAFLNNQKGEELFEIIRPVATKVKEHDINLATKHNGGCMAHRAHQMRNMFKGSMAGGAGLLETAEIVFKQINEISRLKSVVATDRSAHAAELENVRLYYRHAFLNFVIKSLVSRKRSKKLKKNPKQFFSDSKSSFIRFLGRYYD